MYVIQKSMCIIADKRGQTRAAFLTCEILNFTFSTISPNNQM